MDEIIGWLILIGLFLFLGGGTYAIAKLSFLPFWAKTASIGALILGTVLSISKRR